MTPISRRGVLAALAAGVAGTGATRTTATRTTDTTQYVIEQGDRCVPIIPLSGDETVENFYDYRTPYSTPSGWYYSSYGTTDLQRPETSLCFLYDGPEGLSLVVLHDKLHDDTSGGAVSFDLRFENPERGSWLVGDDDYDASSNYDTFDQTAEGWSIDWTWSDSRSDGGVYGHLGDDFAVTIDPAFNEDAELYGDPYEGVVTDWQVLSGDRSDPERFSLALDRPITIRAGGCEKPISADVEVVPGKVNPKSHGRLPVVVHSTDEFDATTLKHGSVSFGPDGATPAKRIHTDTDDDGRTDLKLHFWMDETGIDAGTDRVTLRGKTEAGREVVGGADLQLVPNSDEDDEDDERRKYEDESDESDEREDDEDEDEADHLGNGKGRGKRKEKDHGKGKGRGNGRGRGRGNGE